MTTCLIIKTLTLLIASSDAPDFISTFDKSFDKYMLQKFILLTSYN